MTTKKTRTTTDAAAILRQWFFEDCPDGRAALEDAEVHQKVAVFVYELRAQMGLSQEEFADRADVTPKVIDDIEEGDYRNENLMEVLEKIEAAFSSQST